VITHIFPFHARPDLNPPEYEPEKLVHFVHVIPSGEYIAKLPSPEFAVATHKTPLYATASTAPEPGLTRLSAEEEAVQFIPSVEYEIALYEPMEELPATHRLGLAAIHDARIPEVSVQVIVS